MAHCPAYGGAICSLCCSLDARCHDRCKPTGGLFEQMAPLFQRLLPMRLPLRVHTRIAHYLGVLLLVMVLLAAVLALIYYQESADAALSAALGPTLRLALMKTFAVLGLVAAVGSWWLVLTNESRRVAQEESDRQTQLLLREIEAHRETDAQLQRAKEAAESANQAKSRYLTGMSHELRTPLNSLLGYAQILQRDTAIPASRRNAVAVIRRSGEHLLSLIDDLLDVARIEAGKLRLDQNEVHLVEFLEQIVQMFQLQAQAKGLTFRFEPVDRLPAVVHADERRLRQILINLLANAVKFTDRGGVTFRVSYLRQTARFEVIDTGIGILPEDLSRIFLPFERSLQAQSRSETGTGLGLTITRMLTGLMGGELLVRSRPGEGSTFEMKVYLSEVRSAQITTGTQGDVCGYAGPVRRVLVVDDQASQRAPLVSFLESLRFEVRQADSGEACLREAVAFEPELILLDIAMPGLDGWEVCRLLRRNHVSMAPVILVSANAFENDADKRAAAGCVDFIVKPVFLSELLAKVKTHLDIEWVTNQPEQTAAASELTQVPDAAELRQLRELGSVGYVRGILEKLDEIEGRDGRYGAFAREFRALASAFRLDEYARRLEELCDG